MDRNPNGTITYTPERGFSGANRIIGGEGKDAMNGGPGRDTFPDRSEEDTVNQ